MQHYFSSQKMTVTITNRWMLQFSNSGLRLSCSQISPPNFVIMMDNAFYHSTQLERNPTSSWRKEAIKDWLIKKGAQPRDDMLKVELYDLAKKLCNGKKTYLIDTVAAEAGHKVVRLPPHTTVSTTRLSSSGLRLSLILQRGILSRLLNWSFWLKKL